MQNLQAIQPTKPVSYHWGLPLSGCRQESTLDRFRYFMFSWVKSLKNFNTLKPADGVGRMDKMKLLIISVCFCIRPPSALETVAGSREPIELANSVYCSFSWLIWSVNLFESIPLSADKSFPRSRASWRSPSEYSPVAVFNHWEEVRHSMRRSKISFNSLTNWTYGYRFWQFLCTFEPEAEHWQAPQMLGKPQQQSWITSCCLDCFDWFFLAERLFLFWIDESVCNDWQLDFVNHLYFLHPQQWLAQLAFPNYGIVVN